MVQMLPKMKNGGGRWHPWGFRIPDVPGLDSNLCLRGKNGHVHAVLGLVVTIYIEHGDSPEVREGMVLTYERYLADVGPVFRWGSDPKTFDPVPVVDGVGDVRAWPEEVFQAFDFLMMFHGGENIDDADARTFMAVSREREEWELSFLTYTLPLSWGDEHGKEKFVESVLKTCALMQPFHGFAGLAVLSPIGGVSDADVDAVYGLGSRFPGLEIDAPLHHEGYLSTERRIKGVNWLTILNKDLIALLGGMEALKASLGPMIPIHDFGEGIIIQAGSGPQFGDRQTEGELDNYRRVAGALSSIRSTNPAIIWPQGAGSSFGFDEAKAWMTRFD